MNRYTFFALAIFAFVLFNDFKKDPGKHIKAKVLNTILLSLIFLSYGDTIGIIGSVVRRFDNVVAKFSVDMGIVPGPIHLTFYFVHLTASFAILIFAFKMITRNNNARKNFLRLLPLLGLLSIFSFYRGWINTDEELILDHWMILLIATIVMGGITFLYYKVYNGKLMQEFFATTPESQDFIELSKDQESN